MTDNSDGTVYLLHLDPPLKHARHYTGWTSNLDRRLEAHRAGRGARLLEVVKEAGGTFRLTRTWPGSRALERAIKDQKHAPRLCPECSPRPLPAPAVRMPAPEPEPETGVVPEPAPGPLLRTAWPGRAAAPDLYDDLLPVTDRLISGWQAQAAAALPAPEAELELEPLPAARRRPPPLTRQPKETPPVTSPPEHSPNSNHLFAYITYQPTPYDADLTDDPDLTWDQLRAEPEPEAEAAP